MINQSDKSYYTKIAIVILIKLIALIVIKQLFFSRPIPKASLPQEAAKHLLDIASSVTHKEKSEDA